MSSRPAFVRPQMRALFALITLLGWAAAPVVAAEPKAFTAQGLEFFEQQVRPLLVAKCQSCHGAKTQESGLRLDHRGGMMIGGDSGPAIVAGAPAKSLLIQAVKRTELEMPPDEPLTDEEIATLEKWVRLGAPWPQEDPVSPALGDQVAIGKVASQHWAFQPLTKPQPPVVQKRDWVQSEIDAFILARLEAAGMTPAPRADRRTLIRRVTFNLIGLPPTPEEVAAFVDDPASDAQALSSVVDRLLETPHYGERWGRIWLDVARYADTRDWQAQVDTRYPYAFTYRDWVINAINRDVPYDDFIRMQIAADLYTKQEEDPDLAALGFLTVGPRFRNNLQEQVADLIDVATRGVLALTTTCARCHDHKYDPIPTADYYSLYGVFASCEVPEEFPQIAARDATPEQRRDFERQLTKRQKDFADFKQGLVDDATADFHKRINDYLVGYYEMNLGKTESIRSLLSKRNLKETAMTPLGASLDRITKAKAYARHPVLRAWAALMAIPDKRIPAELKKFLADANEKNTNGLLLGALKSKSPANRQELLACYAELFTQAMAAVNKLPADKRSTGPLTDADLEAFRAVLFDERGPFVLETDAVVNASRLLGTGRRDLAKYENAITDLEVGHPGAPARAMVVNDKEQPVNARVLIRGDPRRPGDPVPRRFLSIIAGPDAKPFEQGSGRRELAEAIVDPQNPLTARVLVNRIWMHHFGSGLVLTPGDFGLRSDPPSHPALLDWLSSTFIEQGWSLKQLHRRIVLSNAWQQAVVENADFAQRDPENRLLWRANRRRLDFEQLRDALLAVTDRLDSTVGGRPVQLSEVPFSPRRTVYGFVDRVNLDPIFTTFDFATPDSSKPERAQTLIPQQSLFQLNHPFVIEQARRLAALPEVQDAGTIEDKLSAIYQRLFGRRATRREVNISSRYLSIAENEPVKNSGPWQYGYGDYDAEKRRVAFEPLAVYTNDQYQAGQEYPDPKLRFVKLDAMGGQAGLPGKASIRRWVAPVDGTIEITGQLKHIRDGGDGVRARVISARGGVLGTWEVFKSEAAAKVASYEVRRGETIDFIVDCKANGSNDVYTWAPVIRLIDSPPAYQNGRQDWDARQDFAPTVPPMTPWEQLAQGLLLTNEFMFLD